MNKYMTLSETSEYIGKSKETLRRWDKEGKLLAVREPMSNYRVYRKSDVDTLFADFLDENIKDKIQIPYDLIIQCQNDQNELKNIQKEYLVHFDWMKNLIDKTKNKIEIELAFVNQYLSKDKTEREKMFLKTVQIKK